MRLTTNRLDGYADCRGLEKSAPEGYLRHYRYLWKPKRHGHPRLIESPKSRLRAVQRQIHRAILNPVPLHQACHGFRRGHSCLSFVRPHVAKRVVVRMDLENFFVSIRASRVHALFTTIGYRTTVARLLTGLCTNQVPYDLLSREQRLSWRQRQQFKTPHLPQGAPTSPTLANLCAFGLDLRLNALAASLGADYTRYADDLAFSGGERLAACADRFHPLVAYIASDEGFALNTRKTRVMRQGASQRLTGMVINHHPNPPRAEYDRLKAILYNCVRHDPASQNRAQHKAFRAHLQGRVAHLKAINPARGRRLQRLFKQIDW